MKRMKKWLTMVVASSMIMGSVPTTAMGATFVDINDAPWEGAITYIEQAQSLGLMSGYLENGVYYCKPTNSVTYSETVQLIYSIMKAAGNVNITSTETAKWSSVLSAYSVTEWVQPAATYALEAGIITSAELVNLRDGSPAADREAVGVIYGKALATLKTVNSAATLSYNDAASISASAVPYLALLYSNSIMAGDTENYFYPDNAINRAEMSVLSVRMYDAVNGGSSSSSGTIASSGTLTGDVTTVMALGASGIFMSLQTSSGSSMNLSSSSGVTVTYEGTTVTVDDIGVGDEVKVTYSGSVVYSIEILDSVLGLTSTLSGDAELVSVTSSKITVEADGEEYTYYLDDPYIEIDGTEISLSVFKWGASYYDYEVSLTFTSGGDVWEIEGTNLNPTFGMLLEVDDDEIVIEAAGVEYEYDMDDPDIELDGDDVDVDELEDAIDEADDDDEYIYVELEFNSSDEVDEIVAEYADLDDLYEDDDDDDDDEDAEYEISGILEDIDDFDSIELDLGYGKYEYELSDEEDTEFDYDESSKVDTIEDFFDDYWDDDDFQDDLDDDDEVVWITLLLNDDFEVISIEAELMDVDDAEEELSSGEGVLTSVSDSKETVTIDDDNGNGKFTFYCDDPDVEYEDDDDADDYDDDLEGLEEFFDDYDDDDYECYVKLEFDDYGYFVIEIYAYEPED